MCLRGRGWGGGGGWGGEGVVEEGRGRGRGEGGGGWTGALDRVVVAVVVAAVMVAVVVSTTLMLVRSIHQYAALVSVLLSQCFCHSVVHCDSMQSSFPQAVICVNEIRE